jgi:glycosyltransferase involved in cell wall biosynthesis
VRILHASQYFLPWLGYQEFYLAKEQVRAGHDVLVMGSNLRVPLDIGYAKALAAEEREMPPGLRVEYGVPSHRLPVSLSLRGRLVLRGVRAAILSFAPDVIHAHGYLLPLTFQVAAARAVNVRLLVDEHQLAQQADRGLTHSVQRRVTAAFARRWLLPRIDHLVPIAPGSRDWLIHGYGCPSERVRPVIPLGADVEIFQPDPAAGKECRRELGVAPGELIVLYTGKVAAHKRIDLLIRSVAALPADLRVTLVVVGGADAEVRSELIALAAELHVSLIVRGAVSPRELAAYFNCADVCAWPADCTVSHLEAAACGKPILIPAGLGVDDRVAGGNGLMVPVGDPMALSRALTRLLRSPELRAAMGSAGRQMIVERYSWQAIAAQFLKLY